VDEVEKLVNGGGSWEVSNVDGTAGSGVCGTESNLEGGRRVLRLCFDHESESDHKMTGSRVQ